MRKGPEYAPQRKKFAADLTREMLQRYNLCFFFFFFKEIDVTLKCDFEVANKTLFHYFGI